MAPYLSRIVEHELDTLLAGLPAVAIDGAKGVGKTVTASARAATILSLDDPAVRSTAEAGGGIDDTAPVLLDEWQRLPEVWDVVRRRV